MVKITTTIWK